MPKLKKDMSYFLKCKRANLHPIIKNKPRKAIRNEMIVPFLVSFEKIKVVDSLVNYLEDTI